MADRPILFSAPMVRALLDGRKTQTRRVMPDRPLISTFDGRPVVQGADGVYRAPPTRYKVDDRLWVREAWRTEARFDPLPPRDLQPGSLVSCEADYDVEPNDGCRGRLRPGMFMPRWASRMTLTVIEVRVQRLQDLSRGDAMEEGCPFPNMAKGPNPRDWYAALWGEINGPGAWDANPWVAAYTLTVEHRNIDAGRAHG